MSFPFPSNRIQQERAQWERGGETIGNLLAAILKMIQQNQMKSEASDQFNSAVSGATRTSYNPTPSNTQQGQEFGGVLNRGTIEAQPRGAGGVMGQGDVAANPYARTDFLDNNALMRSLAQMLGQTQNPALKEQIGSYFVGQKAVQGLQPEYGFANTARGLYTTDPRRGTATQIAGTEPQVGPPTPRSLKEMETGKTKKDASGTLLKEVLDVDPTNMQPPAGAQPRWVPWQGPERPFVLQTGTGPQIVDRGKGIATPVKTELGEPLGIAPTTDMRNRAVAYQKAKPVLEAVSELSEKINTGSGVIAKLRGGAERVKAEANLNDDVAEYKALISGFTPLIARSLGHTGVLTEQDVQSVKEMFPKPGDSKSLRDRKVRRILSLFEAIQGESLGGGETGADIRPIRSTQSRFKIIKVE